MAKKKKKLTKSQKKFEQDKRALKTARGVGPESDISAEEARLRGVFANVAANNVDDGGGFEEFEEFIKIPDANNQGASTRRWPLNYRFREKDDLRLFVEALTGDLLRKEQHDDLVEKVFAEFSYPKRVVSVVQNFVVGYLHSDSSLYVRFKDLNPVRCIHDVLIKIAEDSSLDDELFLLAGDIHCQAPHEKVTHKFLYDVIVTVFDEERMWTDLLKVSNPETNSDSLAVETVQSKSPQLNTTGVNRLEFFGGAYGLLPRVDDRDPGTVLYFEGKEQWFAECSCEVFREGGGCSHSSEIMSLANENLWEEGRLNQRGFDASVYGKLFKPLATGVSSQLDSIELLFDKKCLDDIRIVDSEGTIIFTYAGKGVDDKIRLVERIGNGAGKLKAYQRGTILDRLYNKQLTDNEKTMMDSGYLTPRILYLNSVWQRIAYHMFVEFSDSLEFVQQSGAAGAGLVAFSDKNKLFSLELPENKINGALKAVVGKMIDYNPDDMPVLCGRVTISVVKIGDDVFEVKPQLVVENDVPDQDQIVDLVNIHGLNIGGTSYVDGLGFVALDDLPAKHNITGITRRTISGSALPEFVLRYKTEIESGCYDIATEIKDIKMMATPKEISLSVGALDQDWCYLSFHYQSGETNIPLDELLKQHSGRFIKINGIWIDVQDEHLAPVLKLYKDLFDNYSSGDGLKLSRMTLLKFAASSGMKLKAERGELADDINALLDMRTPTQPALESLNCCLRHYQETGLAWLYFLTTNKLGGLLCDDMGLGKTHQTMALMTALIEEQNEDRPFLVVCPTSVLSHWESKIKMFALALKPIIYHGTERELEEHHGKGDVIITSFGIMRRDLALLCKYDFAVVTFDEIQYLKNNKTKSYKAACELGAGVKIGLTGTPIENSLGELKSLFDVVLPGYLGTDRDFKEKYLQPIEDFGDAKRRSELHRIITPFTLRRLKEAVLDELPPKIEDIRMCELSKEQAGLYKKAISTQAESLKAALQNGNEKIPYMHIFSLLGLLKQICNHPALVEKKPENYDKVESGKWELFKEIMQEVLDGGHKVVVFSQYLGMIEMMERYLASEDVGCVSLTGSTTNRGEVIRRFNEDEDCRVFLGSLMASGTGIDLVSASIVIHYDRWWNAAKEDQATDRVHRIGQTRGVQVFKFVTAGTLEEKISAIIDRKRNLMNDIVQEDSGDSLKSFDRNELLDLLSDL